MKQISVVSVVRPDVIAEMIEAVAVAGVTIETLDSETTDGTVVAILTVDQYDEALRALTRAGFHAVSEDALLVRLDDRPGALAELTCRFRDAGVSLRSIRIVRRSEGKSFVAIATARTEAALGLVKDVLVSGESRTRRTTGP